MKLLILAMQSTQPRHVGSFPCCLSMPRSSVTKERPHIGVMTSCEWCHTWQTRILPLLLTVFQVLLLVIIYRYENQSLEFSLSDSFKKREPLLQTTWFRYIGFHIWYLLDSPAGPRKNLSLNALWIDETVTICANHTGEWIVNTGKGQP